MPDNDHRILPEGLPPEDIVDDLEFTEVTGGGEVYTLYRIVRFTSEVTGHREGFTHIANIVRVRDPAIGTALLRVESRSITDTRVTLWTESGQ